MVGDPQRLKSAGSNGRTEVIDTSPVLADNCIHVVIGAGVAFCIDVKTRMSVDRPVASLPQLQNS